MSPVTSYDELMARQAGAAVRVAGASQSSWNGVVRPMPPEEAPHRGLARWDGTIHYSDRRVSYHLQAMFHGRGRPQSAKTLQTYRDALKVVYHENIHLLTADGTSHAQGSAAYQRPAGRVLEEGVTEAYTQATLNDYIKELGLEEVAPGISSVREPVAYPHYVAAAETFAGAIGRRTGSNGTEVLRRMAIVNTAEKFRVAAELVYSASDLPGRVPETERAAAVQRIEDAMKSPFARVDALKADKPADLVAAAAAGAAADHAAYQEVRSLRQQWSSPAPEISSDSEINSRPEVNSGAEVSSDAEVKSRPEIGSRPEQMGAEELGDAARIGLGATAAIHRPQRLASEQFGSRRQAGQPAQPHQPQQPGRGD